MARNKYPEQPVEQILKVASKLFISKGYEKTSIQNIIDELGLSKGAIYHHFGSKEEILNAVFDQRSNNMTKKFNELIKDTESKNGREKLSKIMVDILKDHDSQSLNSVLSEQITNPQFVIKGLKDCVLEDGQRMASIINEGIEDGSISTDYPDEVAEIFMLLLNIWINPVLFKRTQSETIKRLQFLQHLMEQLGVDIVSDKMIDMAVHVYVEMDGFTK